MCIQLYRPHSERGHLNSYLFLIDRRLKGGFDWVIAAEAEAAGGAISAKFSSVAPSSIFLERNAPGGSFAKWRRRSGGQSRDESADPIAFQCERLFEVEVWCRRTWGTAVKFTHVLFVGSRVFLLYIDQCHRQQEAGLWSRAAAAVWRVMQHSLKSDDLVRRYSLSSYPPLISSWRCWKSSFLFPCRASNSCSRWQVSQEIKTCSACLYFIFYSFLKSNSPIFFSPSRPIAFTRLCLDPLMLEWFHFSSQLLYTSSLHKDSEANMYFFTQVITHTIHKIQNTCLIISDVFG